MDAVNAVPVLADAYRRRRVLEQLHEEYGAPFDPNSLGSQDNWTIVDACIQLGAMSELVSALKIVGDESPRWHQLDVLVRELFPPEIDDEIDQRVRALLEAVPAGTLAVALDHDAFRDYRSLVPADPGTAIEAYDRLLAQPDAFHC